VEDDPSAFGTPFFKPAEKCSFFSFSWAPPKPQRWIFQARSKATAATDPVDGIPLPPIQFAVEELEFTPVDFKAKSENVE
jgi:hypothetical protein